MYVFVKWCQRQTSLRSRLLVWAGRAPVLPPSPLGMGKCYIIGSNNSSGVQFTFDSSNIFGDQLNRGNATNALVAMQWTLLAAAVIDNPQGLGFLLPSAYGCIMFGPN